MFGFLEGFVFWGSGWVLLWLLLRFGLDSAVRVVVLKSIVTTRCAEPKAGSTPQVEISTPSFQLLLRPSALGRCSCAVQVGGDALPIEGFFISRGYQCEELGGCPGASPK